MKKFLAAATAITIAAGLSLAAFVAPASADSTPTPAPVASSTPTSSPTPSATPTSTPSPSPSPTTDTVTTTPSTAPAPAVLEFTATSTSDKAQKVFVCKYVGTPGVNERLQTGQNPIDVDVHAIGESPVVVGSYFNDAQGRSYVLAFDTGQPDPSVSSCPAPTPIYETIVWSMPLPFNGSDGSYPQVGLTQYKGETTEDLNVAVPTTCNTQYQVDVYAETFGSTDNRSNLDAMFAAGLAGPDGAQDGSYLAGAGNNPGVFGLDHAWKYVSNPVCPPPTPVCIPDSAVSYTYSHNDANTGIITVGNVPNSTGVLCHPFWVTATSWTFTTNTDIWPQAVDIVDQLGEISTPGQYTYTAAVTCGQGDIYASTDSSAPSLNPAHYPVDTGYLLGSSNPFPEHFLSDMGFTQTGSSGPTYVVDSDNCWQPPTPTSSVASCRALDGNALNLPAVAGGEWTISWPGNHSKVYGDNTSVSITGASLLAGYVTYTITLADDNSHDIFHVSPYSGTWTPVDASTLGCNTVTGTPTSSVATCEAPTGNSLVLPAVQGGKWTISWPGNHSKVYGDDTGASITGGSLPDGYVTYTITLADDNSHDSFHVTPYSGTWTPVDVDTLGCNIVTGTPTTSVATCEAPTGNSLVLPAVQGGKWKISWSGGHHTYGNDTGASLTGASLPDGYVTYTITLADDNSHDSYNVTPYTGTWTPTDATTLGCAVSYTAGDTCTYVNGVSLTDVVITLDNSASTSSATFVVDGTSYPVAGGSTTDAEVDNVVPGAVIDVYLNGSVFAAVTVAVPDGFGCQPTSITGDPFATPGTCNVDRHTPNSNGSISVDLEVGLTYSITGPGTNLTGITLPQNGTPGDTVVATGLAPGDYTVTVGVLPGFILSPEPTSLVFDVPVPTVICDLAATDAQPTCSDATNPVQIKGSITVALNDNVVYTAENMATFATFVLSSATTPVANGTYDVTVALSTTGIADHFVLPSTPPSWTFVIDGSDLLCLPVLAAWNAGATSTNTTCSSPHLGTITLSHPAGQGDEVDYVVTNNATSAVVYSGTDTSDTVLHVAPGSYTVTASPHNAGDGISGNAGPYAVAVAAATGLACDGNLAFTGGTIGWFGFVLAGGMLFLGIAFLYMKRRGNRAAE
jgi:hypothetical protein